ncbi:MerR family DNA-binding transcriptional regulator [Actinocrispum wychmicini]|uniref:MerR family DNA-binding transcriptional regulator n=1 Tax=Actinocrispum wychmicini TaxID=1213861 RepID=UPI00104705CB|nr:MerR family DNA-binding transcriptional regulator [Actinocrispum wychmicini]
MLTIGRFARLTGLSIHALRHYDDVSLLIPAHTDPRTASPEDFGEILRAGVGSGQGRS